MLKKQASGRPVWNAPPRCKCWWPCCQPRSRRRGWSVPTEHSLTPLPPVDSKLAGSSRTSLSRLGVTAHRRRGDGLIQLLLGRVQVRVRGRQVGVGLSDLSLHATTRQHGFGTIDRAQSRYPRPVALDTDARQTSLMACDMYEEWGKRVANWQYLGFSDELRAVRRAEHSHRRGAGRDGQHAHNLTEHGLHGETGG